LSSSLVLLIKPAAESRKADIPLLKKERQSASFLRELFIPRTQIHADYGSGIHRKFPGAR
jgi:hypothetical protein